MVGMEEDGQTSRSQEVDPGLLRRAKARFCNARVVRIVVVIKFIIALVTCVIVFSQVIDNTEYLISHYCMLNYFEKKFLGQEDVIQLSADSDITLCHSSIALNFTLEDTRVPVNTSAGLLSALCLLTCLAAPVTLRGLQRRRPALVLAWFVVTVTRAVVVTVAAAVFVSRGWSRFTALTRHPVALFMTHLGCALLDVLTDLPALMLYRDMTETTSDQQDKGEEVEGEKKEMNETKDTAIGECEVVNSGSSSSGENVTENDRDRGAESGKTITSQETQTLPEEEKCAKTGERKNADFEKQERANDNTTKEFGDVEKLLMKRGAQDIEDATSHSDEASVSRTNKDDHIEKKQGITACRGDVTSRDKTLEQAKTAENMKSQANEECERRKGYGGTVLVFHEA